MQKKINEKETNQQILRESNQLLQKEKEELEGHMQKNETKYEECEQTIKDLGDKIFEYEKQAYEKDLQLQDL